MGEKPQPALITHFPPEPLCLRVRAGLARTTYSLTVFSVPPPTCLPALSSSFCAPKLGMSLPFLFLYSEARFSEADVGVLVASSFRACMSSATVLNFVRRFAKRSDSHCYFTSTIFHLLSPPGRLLAFAPPLPSVGNALPSLSPLILEAQV